MRTREELYEMGWNDVLGNLRRACCASTEEKRTWCEGIKSGNIGLPRHEPGYVEGAVAVAQAFLDNGLDSLEFKGPEDVVEAMRSGT